MMYRTILLLAFSLLLLTIAANSNIESKFTFKNWDDLISKSLSWVNSQLTKEKIDE
jgi:hypothetical protein